MEIAAAVSLHKKVEKQKTAADTLIQAEAPA